VFLSPAECRLSCLTNGKRAHEKTPPVHIKEILRANSVVISLEFGCFWVYLPLVVDPELDRMEAGAEISNATP
jgi:hypothetical protein